MIGMHGAMLCGATEVEDDVKEVIEVGKEKIQNKVNQDLSQSIGNTSCFSNTSITIPEDLRSAKPTKTSQIIGNEKTEIEKFTYVPKLSPTPSVVPPAYSPTIDGDMHPNRPSAIFQLAVEASIVMISGF